MRAGHELDRPILGACDRRAAFGRHAAPGDASAIADVQPVAGGQGVAIETAHTGFTERGLRAHKGFDFKTTADRDIGAGAGFGGTELKGLIDRDRKALPQFDRRGVERGRHIRAGDGDRGGRAKQKRRSDELAFQRRRARVIADEQICQPERPMIHWPRWRETGRQMPKAPGIILHGRFEARLDDFDHHQNRSERSSFAVHVVYLATENV